MDLHLSRFDCAVIFALTNFRSALGAILIKKKIKVKTIKNQIKKI